MKKDFNTHLQALFSLTNEVIQILRKIETRATLDKKNNAGNGYWEFAYLEYYLKEIVSLLELSKHLQAHDSFRKYVHFPARLIMEIVLQMEHVYYVKNKKGQKAVNCLLLKDLTKSGKASLGKPGDGGKNIIKNYIGLFDIAAKILRLDFISSNVSEKSNRDIKSLCKKSCIIVKKCEGDDLYHFYETFSELSHANIADIGANNHSSEDIRELTILEIIIELAIRFSEMVVRESNYMQMDSDIQNLKRIAGIT